MRKLNSGQSIPNSINQDKNKQTSKSNWKILIFLLSAFLVIGSGVCLGIVTLRQTISADKAVSITIFINSTSLLLLALSKLLFPESKRYSLPSVIYTGISIVWCLVMFLFVIRLTFLSCLTLFGLPGVTIAITLLTDHRQHLLDKDKKKNEPIEPEPNEPAYDKVEEQSSTTTNTAAEKSRWGLIVLYAAEIVITCVAALITF